MSNIAAIVSIADNRQKAKEITYRVQIKRELNQDSRTFGEVLQEEIDKHNKEKATKNPDQSIQSSSNGL